MSRLPAWQSPKSSIPIARRGLCGKLTGSRAREQMIGSMTAWGHGTKSLRSSPLRGGKSREVGSRLREQRWRV
jgi:hypothetical protein